MKKLSRQEMKNVMGGKHQMVCACGSNTVVCGYSGVEAGLVCGAKIVDYCRKNGATSISCVGGSGPTA